MQRRARFSEETVIKNFMLLLVTVFLTVTMSVTYARDGHSSGSGHLSGSHHSGGHRDGGHSKWHHSGNRGGHNRHRSHSSFIFGYGGHFGYPYFRYPYRYPARVIVQKPAAPVTYIEKSDQDEPHYWYYCTEPKGYYPHIKQCPVGWLQVVPHSPKQ